MSILSDYIRLIEVLIWPVLTLIILWIYRNPIKEFIKKIAPRISKISLFGITLELSKTKEFKPSWILSDNMDIRQLTAAIDFQDSYTMTLMNTITSNYDTDYAIVDLNVGKSWLTSRLYIFATVFEMITMIKCLVFVASDNQFLGYVNLKDIRRSLADKYPWFEDAFTKAYSKHFELNSNILLDIKNPNHISDLVQKYLYNIQQLGPVIDPPDTQNWLMSDTDTGMLWEHTQWINKQRLKFDLGGVIQESYIQDSSYIPEQEKLLEILRGKGDFIALVEENGKFKTLIDRKLLVERSIKKIVEILPLN